MPVYWFALSLARNVNVGSAVLIFFILHVLVYPSSNGYNSYMDRDETSVGGIEKPLQPTLQLFVVTILMDVIAISLSLLISIWFAAGVVFYIVCSRLYSFRGIRLKRFPIIGYIVVMLNQGALIFFIVVHGAQSDHPISQIPLYGILAAAFLIGGFYPITQVYQHEADAKDGVTTISMLLGKRGTFAFCAVVYLIAFSFLYLYYVEEKSMSLFLILQLWFVPVIIFFLRWMIQVWKKESAANFKNTMRLNWIASTCTNLAFITLIILQHRG
jgi:1,4-dihydroxy-2-naphthoate octaprenyltransferase